MTSPPRLAGEWEQQVGVLISWPTRSTDWRDNLADAEATYLELAGIITRINHLYVCCDKLTTRQHVQKLLTVKTSQLTAMTFSLSPIMTPGHGIMGQLVYTERMVLPG